MVARFLLRPAPVGQPATLLTLHTSERGECCNQFTWPLFSDFDVLQQPMKLGRGFLSGEERLHVVVLGYRLWQRRFGGDAAILGKTVTLSGQPFTLVGVAPASFHSLDQLLYTQFWVPLRSADLLLPHTSNFESRHYNWLAVTARMRPGVTQAQTEAELALLAKRAAKAYPDAEKDRGFRFEQAGLLHPKDRPFVTLFLTALGVGVLLVLCIACANVANLLLAQAAGRQKEMATRLALGATRGRLLRQILTESVLLALGGDMLGLIFSVWATAGLSGLTLPAPVPLDIGIAIDWRTQMYTFALSVATGLLFGLAPAATAMRREDSLARPGRRWNLRNILVVSQIAMSLVLPCATGLFLRTLQIAASMDIGFRVLMMSVDPRLHGYTAERTTQFLTTLRRRVAALPGVASVACTDVVPLSGGNRSDSFSGEGQTDGPAGRSVDL